MSRSVAHGQHLLEAVLVIHFLFPQTVYGFNPVGFPVINKLSLPLSVPSGTKVLRRKTLAV